MAVSADIAIANCSARAPPRINPVTTCGVVIPATPSAPNAATNIAPADQSARRRNASRSAGSRTPRYTAARKANIANASTPRASGKGASHGVTYRDAYEGATAPGVVGTRAAAAPAAPDTIAPTNVPSSNGVT